MDDSDLGVIATILMVLIVGLIIFGMKSCDKHTCEKNGGVYIWEWSSYGNKCHYKGDKNE